MSILLAVTADLRDEHRSGYLERTLTNIAAMVTGTIALRVLWIDHEDTATAEAAAERWAPAGWTVRWAGGRLGHAATRRALWQSLTADADDDPTITHVAGWEDDFLVTRPVNLDDLAAICDANPDLAQVALLRQPCWDEEARPGTILGHDIRRFTQEAGWIRHRVVWTCNPSVYHVSLCREGWPAVPSSEAVFTRHQRAKGRHFAYHGTIGDPPAIEHIGVVSTMRQSIEAGLE